MPDAMPQGYVAVLQRVSEAPDATPAEDWAWLGEETDALCAHCGGELQRWEAFNRQTYCTPCDEMLHRPQTTEAEKASRERDERLAKCGVPPAYLDYAAATWKGALPAEFAAWCNEPRGCWYIHGAPGRGKTHLAVASLERVLLTRQAGMWCLFADVKETLAEVRRALPDSQRVIRPLRDCSLLVLDDLGAERGTDFEQSAIAEVLRYRHMQGKATVVTSNLSPDALRGEDGMAAIASRITTHLVTHLGGRDRRTDKRKLSPPMVGVTPGAASLRAAGAFSNAAGAAG